MEIQTHQHINFDMCGTPIKLDEGFARIELDTIPHMVVDKYNLVHGGFIFGLADHAAMLAVNHPNVVLGSASVKFMKPVIVEEYLIADAEVTSVSGKKHAVSVKVFRGEELVFAGDFICFVLDKHVLEG